jgi:glycosyltransferase involved in cell wall biosynthesis
MLIINSLGIQDSGGITVLDKLLTEIENSSYKFLIICNENKNIQKLVNRYKKNSNFDFKIVKNKGFLNRLYFENITFRKIIKERKISLVYNFSGSAQFFLPIPQITKVHNLLFYSKKIDKVYFEKKEYLKWFKQIFLKQIVFHKMLKQTKYIEVQSSHVQDYISDFIDVSKKQFFIKSDIEFIKDSFSIIKNYDFTKKIRFLFIVGPHFEYLHKNFEDFIKTMIVLKKKNFDFEVVVTLSKEQLYASSLWDKELDENTIFLGYVSKDKLNKQFINNTILISTSVIETLGLHVIEAIQNGVLSICPNENYSRSVYGNDIITYELFNEKSLVNKIEKIILLNNNDIKDIITRNQNYLIDNESQKYNSIIKIFDEILSKEHLITRKENNV